MVLRGAGGVVERKGKRRRAAMAAKVDVWVCAPKGMSTTEPRPWSLHRKPSHLFYFIFFF